MKTKVAKIGNSQGIRIPKSMIEESGLTEEVELEVSNGTIIIRPILKERELWGAAFKKMAENNDDNLLDSEANNKQTKWDKEEWEW